ncbi:MAG TPA: hypothetical protein VMI55_07825 [Thermoplasmata archaeon]|nr:hypothetical protein [Thermoplasmata archaeon]
MGDPSPGPPLVALPRPVERRLRLGPFASARDAVKFAGYAATGALLAPFVAPYAWLPVLGAGFLLTVWRPEGEALDERVARWATWRVRRLARGAPMTDPATPPARGGFLRVGPGQYVTILRVGGTPLAYRPPAELERVFRAYVEALQSSEGILFLHAGSVPLSAEAVTPRHRASSEAEEPARAGYRELVAVLCRRRLVRRVDLAVPNATAGPDLPAHLERATRALAARLAATGLRPVRLEGRALSEAGRRFGWRRARAGA